MLDTLKNNAGNLANADLQNMMIAVADTSTQYDGGDYIMTDDKARWNCSVCRSLIR